MVEGNKPMQILELLEHIPRLARQPFTLFESGNLFLVIVDLRSLVAIAEDARNLGSIWERGG